MGPSGQRAGHEPAPRVVAIPAPGHTPGHGFVRVISQGQELFCTTDMLGHEIQVEFSEWSMSHEVDYEEEAAVRLRVLKAAVESRTLPCTGPGKA
jgi:glyoxylase-like metal-dependent hydrolase (beta-lactamase superfamily II)